MNAARKARKAARRAAAQNAPAPSPTKKPAAQPRQPQALSQQAILDLFTAPDQAPAAPQAKCPKPFQTPGRVLTDRQARTAAAIARRQEDGLDAPAPAPSAVRFDPSTDFAHELAAVAAKARAEYALRAATVSAFPTFRHYLAAGTGALPYRPSSLFGQQPIPPQHFLTGHFDLLHIPSA